MPISIALTDDKLVALVKLIKPEKPPMKSAPAEHDRLEPEVIFEFLNAQKFAFSLSVELINQEVAAFKDSPEKIQRLKIYTDKLLKLASYFKLHISKDEMSAFVDVDIPPAEQFNEPIKLPMLMRMVKNAGITACTLTSNLNKLINTFNKQKGHKITKYPIATGIPELMAEDGHLEFHVPFDKKQTLLKEIKKGGVRQKCSLAAISTTQSYPKGTKLLTRYLPQKGREGLSITNKKIWSNENRKDVFSPPVAVSKNVEARTFPEKIEYYSQAKGIGHFIDNKIIEVEEVFDGEFKVLISEDKMQLLLNLSAPQKGKEIDEKAIHQRIASLNIKAKINTRLIHESVFNVNQRNPVNLEGVCIAQGSEPLHGLDGRLMWNIQLEMFYRPRIMEDGSVDYRGGNRFPFVRAGQIAGKWVPMTKGRKTGYDIFGQPLPPRDGKEIELSLNDMFEFEDVEHDNRQARLLKAKYAGLLTSRQGKVFIDPVFETDRIDNSTGNIDFDGTVIIKGPVADGFTIKCTKDIHIHEGVGACYLEAGGDIYVKGGMNGREQGTLKARGNIFINYAENCTLEAKGSVYVATHTVRSHLTAVQGEIRVGINRKKGRIIGGELYAWQFIQTSLIGSERSAHSAQLWVGINKETCDEWKDVGQRIEKIKQSISIAEKQLFSSLTEVTAAEKPAPAARHANQAISLTEATVTDIKVREGLEEALRLKKDELNALIARQQELQQAMYNPEQTTIEVTEKAEEQTVVLIQDKSLKLVAAADKVRFRLNENFIIKEKLKK